jgi:hypothetical protein
VLDGPPAGGAPGGCRTPSFIHIVWRESRKRHERFPECFSCPGAHDFQVFSDFSGFSSPKRSCDTQIGLDFSNLLKVCLKSVQKKRRKWSEEEDDWSEQVQSWSGFLVSWSDQVAKWSKSARLFEEWSKSLQSEVMKDEKISRSEVNPLRQLLPGLKTVLGRTAQHKPSDCPKSSGRFRKSHLRLQSEEAAGRTSRSRSICPASN